MIIFLNLKDHGITHNMELENWMINNGIEYKIQAMDSSEQSDHTPCVTALRLFREEDAVAIKLRWANPSAT